MKCYFVRGLSRSGGTLMATILDAHPDVAMSYETYEHLLTPVNGADRTLSNILDELANDPIQTVRQRFFSKASENDRNFTKFVNRAERAGIQLEELKRLFVEHFEQGMRLDNFRHRMRFVERISKAKMEREGKRCWGGKIVSIYDQLDELYPEARYIFMLRDGRDIAASRKNVGAFKQTIEHIADGWCRQICRFEKFARKSNGRGVFVSYEGFAQEPATELQKLMAQLELPWSDRLLASHELDLSIHRNATGHLSREQISSPINTSSIGRWRTDLTWEEAARFEERAGEMLEKLGYL